MKVKAYQFAALDYKAAYELDPSKPFLMSKFKNATAMVKSVYKDARCKQNEDEK